MRQSIPNYRGSRLRTLVEVVRGRRLRVMQAAFERCGEIVSIQGRSRPLILVSSAEHAYRILVEEAAAFEKGPALRVVTRPLLGNGLLTADNSFHHKQRRLLASTFAPRRVAAYAPTMAEFARQAQAGWTDGQVVDIHAEMMRLTLAIAGKTLFNADVTHEASELGREITRVIKHAASQLNNPFALPYHWPTPGNRRSWAAIQRLDSTIYRLIGERRASGVDEGDFLSMLLQAQDEDDGSRMTDQQVRDEAMTIFLAGHETTANALTWTTLLLSQHPPVYRRLQAEVEAAVGTQPPTADDLRQLPLGLNVLKEGMRIYPPAYAIGREAVQDVQLGEYEVPKGSVVIICPYLMHRRPDYFPDPKRFLPDRFAGDAERRLPRGAYLPFSDGPRNCIGAHFAQLEAQLVLAVLAQHVRFELLPGQRIEPDPVITLRPRRPIWMRVVRERRPAAAPPAH